MRRFEGKVAMKEESGISRQIQSIFNVQLGVNFFKLPLNYNLSRVVLETKITESHVLVCNVAFSKKEKGVVV